MKSFSVIAQHIEATALCWALGTKSADDHVTAVFYLVNVCEPMLRHGEEVKHRAVMPDVVEIVREIGIRHISMYPLYGARSIAQTLLREVSRAV